ncbi:MAG: glycosyltransferase family 87 protein, partial [Anaerolineae bacterium]|nr:glycosyltransferase family 87 protein [Anaerolineae bacterium]
MLELSRRPPGRVSRLVNLVAGALLVSGLVLLVAFSVVWSWPREGRLLDWGSFIASGRAAAEGLDPYRTYPLTFRVYFARTGVVATPNLNPPVFVMPFQALSGVEPTGAHRVWYVISFGTYLVALALLIRGQPLGVTFWRTAWALSLAALWHTLQLGQIYAPLLLTTAGAWLLLQRKQYLAAGLLVGMLVAIKPNFAVWPLLLLAGGYRRAAFAAAGCAAVLSAVPLAAYGPGIYGQWLAAGASFQGLLLPGNSSLPGLAARLGVPWLGIPLAGALVVTAAMLVWRCRPSVQAISSLGVVVSLLASPITWLG